MKKTLVSIALLGASLTMAQVGINTEEPKATLDVVASPGDLTKTDGFIAPRLTGDELRLKNALYNAPDQTGAVIYATAADSAPAGKTINVTEEGYYYFDGSVWVKFGSGAGATGTEPWFVQGTANEATANSENIYQQGKVGVGFTDADGVSDKQLEVKGHFKTEADVAGRDVGIDTDFGGIGNYMYSLDDATNLTNPIGSYIGVTSFGLSSGASSATDRAYMSASPGAITLEVGEPGLTDNVGRINLQSFSIASNDAHVEISASKGIPATSHNGRSSILLRSAQGVEFRYYDEAASLDDIGKYTFPRAAGTVGQVLGIATATPYGSTGGVDNQLSWQNVSDLAPEPWRIQGTTNPATSNTQNIYQTGNVSIGSQDPIAPFTSNGSTITPKLSVTGDVASTGAFYTTTGKYADYVFEDYFNGVSTINEDYKFMSLDETAKYIQENKHLPGVTPIKDILKTDNGYTVNLSELSIQQLEKIEELYLHTIEQQNLIEQQETEIQDLKSRFAALETLLLKEKNN